MRPRPASVAVVAAVAGLATSVFALAPGADAGRDSPARADLVADSTSHPRLALTGHTGAVRMGSLAPAISVNVSSVAIGQPMRPGFLGLSIEYNTLSAYLGDDPARVDPVFLALVRALDPGGRAVLRIGGNSTDRTWWPVRGMRRPASVDLSLSRRWLQLARALATGLSGRLLLGVNLGAGSPRLAQVEARHLVAGVGARHLAALEVGNEPDDYAVIPWRKVGGRRFFLRSGAYGARAYLRQFTRWRAKLPNLPLAGPALARTAWMPATLRFLLRPHRHLAVVTFHRYPLRACETNPRAGDYPTIPRLLSDAASAGLAARVAPFVATAHAAGRQFRLDELNSASCTGKPGVSNTFASALWAVKTLFDLRAVGVDAVNLHMLPGSAYQAFAVAKRGDHWSASVAPVYYGMLMFARAFPPGARLLRLSEGGGWVSAWATRASDRRIRVVLVNANATGPVTVRLRLPGAPVPLGRQRLLASSLSATTGVSLGGDSFGARTSTGVLRGSARPARVQSVRGIYSVTLPAGSAVLLTR